jgi:uncharacterized OsmC-like protein
MTTPDPATIPERREAWAVADFEGRARCAITVKGGHTLVTDEPTDLAGGLGGDNAGPTPLGYLVAAFAADIPVVLERIGREMQIEISTMRAKTTIVYNPRGIRGLPGYEPTPHEAVSDIWLTTSAGVEALDELKAQYERRCPVYNILRKSGCRMIDNWHISAG